MSNQQVSYADRLNIPTITVNKAKSLVKNEITNYLNISESDNEKIKRKLEKQTFRLIGPAGIGKTQICKQICDELKDEINKDFELIIIKAPVLNRDDFLIPFPIIDSNKNYKKFEMLYSDFVPGEDKPYGLFVIDELSRGDHSLQQLMWQVENENMIHLKEFPPGWFVVCLDNPDEAEYSVDVIEDAAGLRRKSQICVEHSNTEFIKYAEENEFYPDVVSYFRTHPDRIYDVKAQKNKMVYTNPASIEKFSFHCWKYDPEGTGKGIKENFDNVSVIADSLFNKSAGQQIMDFLEDSTTTLKPEDIIYHNHTKEIKEKVNKMIEGRNPKLSDLMVMVVQYLSTNRPKLTEKIEKNIVDFLTTVPIDIAAIFVTETEAMERSSKEFDYMVRLHMTFTNKYKKYIEEFHNKLKETKYSDDSEDGNDE
ncbi:MAG: ATP-binding protein [Candidatus Izimaplasma sp.]|nr:ATP-binding protein [Candidatus Izimaplasma bacterium]